MAIRIRTKLPRSQTMARNLFRNFYPKFKISKEKALYQTLGLIRRTTRQSMRTRDGASRPGTPPHAHTRGGLRVIKFDADVKADAGLVGPVKFPGSNFFNEPVPHIHEFGGEYVSRRSIATYPERSFMWGPTKKLIRRGKIIKRYSVALGRLE